MSYDPAKPPQTLGQHILQSYLGRNGIRTGTSLSNQAGYNNWKREQDQKNKKSWRTGGTTKK